MKNNNIEQTIIDQFKFTKHIFDKEDPKFDWFIKKIPHTEFKNLAIHLSLFPVKTIEVYCDDLSFNNVGEVKIINKDLPADDLLCLLTIQNILSIFK